MPQRRRFEYLKYALQQLDALKNSVYVRASIILAANGILIAKLTDRVTKIVDATRSTPLHWLVVGSIVLSYICLAASIVWGVLALQPLGSIKGIHHVLMKRRPEETAESPIETFTAFPHITKIRRQEFMDKVDSLTDDEITKQLASAMYTLSCIIEEGYLTLRLSFLLFLFALIALAILLAVLFMGVIVYDIPGGKLDDLGI